MTGSLFTNNYFLPTKRQLLLFYTTKGNTSYDEF